MVQETKEGVARRSRGMQDEILEREIEQKEATGFVSSLLCLIPCLIRV